MVPGVEDLELLGIYGLVVSIESVVVNTMVVVTMIVVLLSFSCELSKETSAVLRPTNAVGSRVFWRSALLSQGQD